METLRKGDTGPDVRTMQQALAAAGHLTGSADAMFGPTTEQDLMSFQEAMCLDADGICGPLTWYALDVEHTPADPEYPVNMLISNGLAHDVPRMHLINFCHPSVPVFAQSTYQRADEVTELMFHESCGYSTEGAVSTLLKKGYGAQFIVESDGTITQHGDLLKAHYIHASAHNPHSAAIEIVTPYYGHLLKHHHPWKTVLQAPWAHKGQYVVATPPQAEAVCQLTRRLTKGNVSGMNIPRKWAALDGHWFHLGAVEGGIQPSPGIWAHHNVGGKYPHADAAWMSLYTWLRLRVKLKPSVAYLKTNTFCEGTRGPVDVSMYVS